MFFFILPLLPPFSWQNRIKADEEVRGKVKNTKANKIFSSFKTGSSRSCLLLLFWDHFQFLPCLHFTVKSKNWTFFFERCSKAFAGNAIRTWSVLLLPPLTHAIYARNVLAICGYAQLSNTAQTWFSSSAHWIPHAICFSVKHSNARSWRSYWSL